MNLPQLNTAYYTAHIWWFAVSYVVVAVSIYYACTKILCTIDARAAYIKKLSTQSNKVLNNISKLKQLIQNKHIEAEQALQFAQAKIKQKIKKHTDMEKQKMQSAFSNKIKQLHTKHQTVTQDVLTHLTPQLKTHTKAFLQKIGWDNKT